MQTLDLNFQIKNAFCFVAILIKASMSHENYRPGFDISFPLFSKTHPERGPQHVFRDTTKTTFVSFSFFFNLKS